MGLLLLLPEDLTEELQRFLEVWLYAIISISYCYYLPPRINAGVLRLLSILPVCVQFFVSPMLFSFPVFTYIIMFFLTGVGTLKLILFAFDKGPLFPLPSSLLRFICFTCFPVEKLQQNPRYQSSSPKWVLFAIKAAIFGVLVMLHARGYRHNIPSPLLLWGLYPLYLYLSLEIPLTLTKSLLTIILGCDLEPVFDEPYLATSLQDFWGRRWNTMVSSLLWSSIYTPIRSIFKGNPGLAKFIGVLATFLASGLFHELLFYYSSGTTPSGEVTFFYVLQGIFTAAEMAVKRSTFGQRWELRPVVSWLLTMTFLIVTSGWLYFPQIVRGKAGHYITKYIIS